MSTEIVLRSRWSVPENRRREALRAAHGQDAEVLGELLEYHLRLKSRRAGVVSASTLRTYRLAVRDFLGFVGPPEAPRHALNQLDAEVIERYLIGLRGRGLEVGSVRTYLYGVRALFRALVWAGALSQDPAREVRAPHDATPAHAKKRAVGAPQLGRLFALPGELHGDDEVGRRDGVILTLGATLGLRASEIVGLDVADVNLGLGEVHVRHGKGGKARRVPLTRSAAQVLGRWLQAREALRVRGEVQDDQPGLLVSFRPSHFGARLSTRGLREIVNGYLAAAGLPPDMFGVHTLRRTAGTRLYRATRDLHVVSDILGHASVTTSAIYAKMDQGIRREALQKVEDDEP
ncbi:tyrosine recombinase XerC [Deinococcus aetherius]|uniref:Tyrosine recombinase XerC n=1 Tax=Deinococcus aetherius TaxID=200252 RepID=A0ABM8ADA3_9DEIO|nr:tyrosine-type recombinase/integrase [Deinococcus aetherius]BDP41617.1 tyrosine recombinase XerC [Deinococcus aetherius]